MRSGFVSRLQNLAWRIRTKIAVAFGLVLFLFVLNGVISLVLLTTIKATEERERNTTLYLSQLQQYSLAYSSESDLYAQAVFVTKLKPPRNTFRAFLTDALTQHTNTADAEQKAFLLAFAEKYQIAVERFLECNTALVKEDVSKAQAIWQQSSNDITAITTFLNERTKQLQTQNAEAQDNLNHANLFSITAIIVFACISIFLALGLLWLISAVLVVPLNQLATSVQRMGEGDLDQAITIANRDEIGLLTRNFQHAMLSLKQVLQSVQVGRELQAVAEQLAIISQQQAEGATHQVTALTQINIAMDELGATASSIANEATTIADLIVVTLGHVEQVQAAGTVGRQRTQQLIDAAEKTLSGVETIEQETVAIAQSMRDLDKQTLDITTIVTLLTSLTNEVHLLALNAAIEAAGAAAFGERFGVIAQEINALAQRASNATQDVQTLIRTVQQSSQIALIRVERGKRDITRVVEVNGNLRSSVQAVEQSSTDVVLAVTELRQLANRVNGQALTIKSATQQQSTAFAQVVAGAYSVQNVAEHMTTVTRQVTTTSIQIEGLVRRLNTALRQVKTGTMASPSEKESEFYLN